MAHNVITAQLASSLKNTASIFAFDTRFAQLYKVRDLIRFDNMALELSSELAKMKPADKKSFSARIAQNNTLGSERGVYERFIQLLNVQEPNIELLQGALIAIRDAAIRNNAGIAVALMDAEAETLLDHNTISGSVSLYGMPLSKSLSQPQLNTLNESLKADLSSFKPAKGVLRLRDNRLSRLLLGRAMVKAVREALKRASTATDPLSSGLVTGNVATVNLPAGRAAGSRSGRASRSSSAILPGRASRSPTAPAPGRVLGTPPAGATTAPVTLNLAGMYRLADLGNNHFNDSGNELLAERATVSSNDFAGASAGFVIAKSATYTGNNGPTNNSVLNDITQVSAKLGNVITVN